jgi:hypothetical protein
MIETEIGIFNKAPEVEDQGSSLRLLQVLASAKTPSKSPLFSFLHISPNLPRPCWSSKTRSYCVCSALPGAKRSFLFAHTPLPSVALII